jgi:hypothetical protein
MNPAELKQWRSGLVRGDKVLYVRRHKGEVDTFHEALVGSPPEGTNIWIYPGGDVALRNIMPESMAEEFRETMIARDDARIARREATQAAVQALFDAGADLVITPSGTLYSRDGGINVVPTELVAYRVM